MGDRLFNASLVSEKISSSKSYTMIKSYTMMLGVLIRRSRFLQDISKYIQIATSGRFYEEFGDLLIRNNLLNTDQISNIREHAKKITFRTLFSKNYYESFDRYIMLFKEAFPNVLRIFRRTKRIHHRALAVALQSLEADIVLNKACKIINDNYPEVPIFTLHDSIITTEENVNLVKEIMHRTLEHYIGYPPVLKEDRWE